MVSEMHGHVEGRQREEREHAGLGACWPGTRGAPRPAGEGSVGREKEEEGKRQAGTRHGARGSRHGTATCWASQGNSARWRAKFAHASTKKARAARSTGSPARVGTAHSTWCMHNPMQSTRSRPAARRGKRHCSSNGGWSVDAVGRCLLPPDRHRNKGRQHRHADAQTDREAGLVRPARPAAAAGSATPVHVPGFHCSAGTRTWRHVLAPIPPPPLPPLNRPTAAVLCDMSPGRGQQQWTRRELW